MEKRIAIILLCFIASLTLMLTSVSADQYTYDSLGRVEAVEYDDGSKAVFQYDQNGNIESLETEAGKSSSVGGNPGNGGGKDDTGNLNAGEAKKTEGEPGESAEKQNPKDDPASNPATKEKQSDSIKVSTKTVRCKTVIRIYS